MRTNSKILDPSGRNLDNEATALTRARYQRISPIYDRVEWLMERRFRPWREKLWQSVRGPKVLEVGVGTGKNMDILTPLIVRLNGAHINRITIENVRAAGLEIERIEDVDEMGMFKLISARPRA